MACDLLEGHHIQAGEQYQVHRWERREGNKVPYKDQRDLRCTVRNCTRHLEETLTKTSS